MENNPPDEKAGSVSYPLSSGIFSKAISSASSSSPLTDSQNVQQSSNDTEEGPSSKKRKKTDKLAIARDKQKAMQEYEKRPLKERYDEFLDLKNTNKELEDKIAELNLQYGKRDVEAEENQKMLQQAYEKKSDEIKTRLQNEIDGLKIAFDAMQQRCDNLQKLLTESEKKAKDLDSQVKKEVESAGSVRKPKDILSTGWNENECNEYFGKNNPVLRLQIPITKASKPVQKERVERCLLEMAWIAAPYSNYNDVETQNNLKKLLEDVANNFGLSLYTVKKLDPLETASIFNSCGMTVSMSKRLRSLLNENNIFASANKVNELLKNFDKECEIKVENIKVDEENEIEVCTVADLKLLLKNRYQRLSNFGKLKINPSPFENEIWICILGDKGGTSMKLALALGNQDNPNSSEKLLLCGLYDGLSSAKNIYEAFKKLAKQIKEIEHIDLEIDGDTKRYKVRWFLSGDYEFLLQVCGRKSASATYYCCRCLFAKPNPNSFHNPDACGKGLLRENFEPISTDTGYIQEPLFSNIPPNLIIMPCLHIFMGIVTMLITLLEESLKREDFKKLTTEQREEIENNLKTADTEIVAMENKLNKNKTIILEAEKNREMLQDIKKSNEAISSLSSNKGQRNRCQMDYCAKRAGYPIDDNIRSCSCCQRAKNYHEFCIGSHAASKSITCSGLQKYQQKGGLLAEIPKLMTKLKKDIDKSKSLVQSLTAKIEYSIVQKYEASGDNMKQYADILDEMRISKRVWYQTFVGNHIHKLLLNADKFEKLDCLTESRDLQNIILALKLLKQNF